MSPPHAQASWFTHRPRILPPTDQKLLLMAYTTQRDRHSRQSPPTLYQKCMHATVPHLKTLPTKNHGMMLSISPPDQPFHMTKTSWNPEQVLMLIYFLPLKYHAKQQGGTTYQIRALIQATMVLLKKGQIHGTKTF